MKNWTKFHALMMNTTTGELVVFKSFEEALKAEKNGFKLIRCSGKNF